MALEKPLPITELDTEGRKLKHGPKGRERNNAKLARAVGDGNKEQRFGRIPYRATLVSGKRDGNHIQRSERDGVKKGMPLPVDVVAKVRQSRKGRQRG